jgi:hypothetical protein
VNAIRRADQTSDLHDSKVDEKVVLTGLWMSMLEPGRQHHRQPALRGLHRGHGHRRDLGLLRPRTCRRSRPPPRHCTRRLDMATTARPMTHSQDRGGNPSRWSNAPGLEHERSNPSRLRASRRTSTTLMRGVTSRGEEQPLRLPGGRQRKGPGQPRNASTVPPSPHPEGEIR